MQNTQLIITDIQKEHASLDNTTTAACIDYVRKSYAWKSDGE